MNQNNALARRKLAALLATGLFVKLGEEADEVQVPTLEELKAHRELRNAALEHSRKTMSPIIARYLWSTIRETLLKSVFFPDGTFKPHPAIIVSNDQLQEDEDGMFYLVLITSNDWLNPQYSYPLSDEMVDGFAFSKPSLMKCQIITGNIERDVTRRLGSIKQKYFDEIVDKIVESIF